MAWCRIAGSAVLRLVADNTGLTAGLSRALARRGFAPVHDRGRVLTDLGCASLMAVGCCRTWPPCGISASCSGRSRPTRPRGAPWRSSADASGPRIATARAKIRRRVWALIATGSGDPAVSGRRRRSREDGGDPSGRHDPDRALGQGGCGGHVQGHLRALTRSPRGVTTRASRWRFGYTRAAPARCNAGSHRVSGVTDGRVRRCRRCSAGPVSDGPSPP